MRLDQAAIDAGAVLECDNYGAGTTRVCADHDQACYRIEWRDRTGLPAQRTSQRHWEAVRIRLGAHITDGLATLDTWREVRA